MGRSGPLHDPVASFQTPRVSVVIPTFNRADVVQRAIESALAQSVPPAEIVVVDDGSTDDTAAKVSGIDSATVRYLSQANAGGGVARNHGVREARNAWIAFLDSDDAWCPDHIERLTRALVDSRGRAHLYFSDTIMACEGMRGSIWELSAFSVDSSWEMTDDGTDWVMRSIQPMMLQSSLVDRGAFIAAGGFWERLRRRHDTHLFFKLGVGAPICAVASVGAIMTADGDPAVRLTEAFGSTSRVYAECSERLYTDLLHRFPNLDSKHRTELAERAARAHISLAKASWRDDAPRDAIGHIAQATALSPTLVASRAFGRVFGVR